MQTLLYQHNQFYNTVLIRSYIRTYTYQQLGIQGPPVQIPIKHEFID
jgi:hypothetical protein